MSKPYDIVVLGGGTGGYIAAIRAAQLGKSVAIVEKDKLGGTCLHRGCIPSKALLRSAELFSQMKRGEEFGITASSIELQYETVAARKDKVVSQPHQGVNYLMKKHKIDVYEGYGRVIGPSIFSPRSGAVAIELANGDAETIVPQHLIIATGSRPRQLQGLPADGTHVLTSDEALQLTELPESVIIVGGGVIGVEWASMLNDFGVQVTIIEAGERLVPQEDEDISRELAKQFTARGIMIYTEASLFADTAEKDATGISIQVEREGERIGLRADKLLVSIGREANIERIGLDNTDIRVDKGVIRVNGHLQTDERHIYAIGDVIGGLQLAHAAAHEGIAAVEHAAGLKPHTQSSHLIPRCIYTRSEIASVGWTEKQAREQGFEVKVGKIPFAAIGKAVVYGETEGFAKVVADKKSNDILGVHIIGPHATDAISEAALVQWLNAAPWEVGASIHPHPTLSEIIGEAMLAVDGSSFAM